ncbi:MAG: condensation domain-containing protein, partial [Tumebacillaceae bacterium]
MNYLSKENVQEIQTLTRLKDHFVADEMAASTAGAQLAQVAYQVEGEVDATRLQQAWDHVIQTHAELRSVYRSMKGRMVQVVLKTRPIALDVRDARGLSDADVQALVEDMLLAQLEPMIPGEGPLMRLSLVQRDAGPSVLVWTHHRMVLDERSRGLVLADVLATYGALTRGESLPACNRPNYKDYLTWLAGQDWSDAKTDWTAQLAGFEAPTQLLNGPRVHQPVGVREVQRVELSKQTSDLLNELAKTQGVFGVAIAHTAWALLLNVYSGEENVFYGATVSGRPADLAGASELVGRFMNTLPARVTVDGEQPVVELLRAMQEQQYFLKKYAYLPLQEVREFSGVEADVALFASSLAVYGDQEQPFATLADGTLRLEATQWGADVEPLTIDVVLGERWHVVFSTAPNAWDTDTVQRMQAHFVTLLESIATQPTALVRELNVLPEAERAQLFTEFNQTLLAQPDLNLLAHQVIEAQVAQRPDEIACLFEGERVTYRELNERANRLAHWLREQGFGRDDLAALFAERSSDMLIAIVAVMKAGGAYVPLDSANPDQRLRTIIENSKAKVILTQHQLTERSKELANGLAPEPLVFCLDRAAQGVGVPDVETLQGYSSENPAFINEPGDLANVFFTSGSTGLPKGAMIEHIGMLNHLYAKINLLGMTETSVVVQNAS